MTAATMTAAEKVLAAVRERTGSEPRRAGNGWTMRCPAHDDGTASLSVGAGTNGALVHCHAGCSFDAVLAAVGLTAADLFDGPTRPAAAGLELASYAHVLGVPAGVLRSWGVTAVKYQGAPAVRVGYLDEHGAETWHRWRIAMAGDKFRSPKGSKARGQLYGRSRLADARAAGSVVVVEGESDCHVLWHAGFAAVGVPGAAMWDEQTCVPLLDGITTVYVVVEPDQGGEKVREWVARSSVRDRVKLVDLGEHNDPRGLHDHDRANFPAAFQAALDRARPWADVYAERRVAAEGPPVDGALLLDDLATFVRRFVVVTAAQAQALALWIVHTHAIDAADVTPFMSVTSPEKGSGKTRSLEVLALLVRGPWPVITPSPSVMFRKIERDRPTLLLDEIDGIFKDRGDSAEALRSVLNAGNNRFAAVARSEATATGIEIRDFNVFCARALAGIGDLPGTLADRAIAIRLRKRRPDEHVERYRRRTVLPEAVGLHGRCERWALQHVAALKDVDVAVLLALDDRKFDLWEPLLAIADKAGGAWPARARAAAVELSSRSTSAGNDESIGLLLLRDLRSVWPGTANAPTETLIDALKQLDESPWADWDHGRGLSARTLARLLKPYAITSTTVRIGDRVAKGYRHAALADAWARYCPEPAAEPVADTPTPPPAAPNPLQGHIPHDQRDCGSSASVTRPPDVTDENGRKPAPQAGCDLVTDAGPVQGGSAAENGGGDFDWRTETTAAPSTPTASPNGDRP